MIGDGGDMAAAGSFPENKVLFRFDTNAPLSVVGHRFKVVQPNQILEFYRDLIEVSGFELETAGVLFSPNRRGWVTCRLTRLALSQVLDRLLRCRFSPAISC